MEIPASANDPSQLKYNSGPYQPTYTQPVVRLVLYLGHPPGDESHADRDKAQGNANDVCCNESGSPIIRDVLLFE